ncbi:MAG: hypothetical protein M3426_10575, partial [Actinomycetota bacterium]|nr:hypothetical protein [Actinomycetota bacterium]
ADAAFPNDRGLNFLCYQADIQEQFEFLQTTWVNNQFFPNLPELNDGNNDGHDPIISQNVAGRTFTLPITATDVPHLTGIPRWVTTTGGEYFFQPSIDALCQLAGISDGDEVKCRPGERLLTHLERLEGGSS